MLFGVRFGVKVVKRCGRAPGTAELRGRRHCEYEEGTARLFATRNRVVVRVEVDTR